ncbi:CHASE2 domain-containing protein [Prosthecomicrobium sp. N25]|uniref:CHASE2 domain-containing protein n=1 Tax=Prosthecomicrobium sp. N25 TaxID=3129254 RepID=UPI003077FC5C
MRLARIRRPGAAAAGFAVLALALGAWSLAPGATGDRLGEAAVDALFAAFPRQPADDRVRIVDIDRDSLAALGPWPWPRERLAALLERIAAAKPAAVALDVLLDGPDRLSVRSAGRLLAERLGRPELADLGREVPDADERLAAAAALAPTVAGLVLAPEPGADLPPPASIAVTGGPAALDPWAAPGALSPPPGVAGAVRAVGVLSLPAGSDGTVRSVPMLALADGRPYAGLAAEAVRAGLGAGLFMLAPAPPTLTIGDRPVRLGADATMRLRPASGAAWAGRVVPAARVLADGFDGAGLAGRIVFVGSSAPEAGGLRATVADPLAPSVRIQAEAAGQILDGRSPVRPAWAALAERLAAGVLGLAALAAALRLGPAGGLLATGLVTAAWSGTAAAATLAADTILDPATPALVAAATFATTALAAFAATRRREAALRRRFEQHLAPDVVRRIVENPGLVRLEGEIREITTLFTDIEGFTSMTERAEPAVLVALLDRYFEGLIGILVDHGATIDKVVGDAVHAFFNAPLDVPDHARRAVEAGLAVVAFAEAFRQGAEARALGLGRTRVGIETGRAIVGDVGGGRKLDYTAHGDAVNSAARLEASNKLFGSAIAVGPGTRARVPGIAFRSLGTIRLRGRGSDTVVVEPWPHPVEPAIAEAWETAAALMAEDPPAGRKAFAALASKLPGDPVAERLSAEA